MLPTRSAAKPEQNLHEYCKSPQAGIPSDLWAFCHFSVLSASVFCPRDPVRRGWTLCRVWEPQPVSVHGCAFYLDWALVRVPARSRGADRSWTPLRVPAVRVSASPPTRAQAVLSVRFLASPPARAQPAFPAQAGGPEPTPKQAVLSVRFSASLPAWVPVVHPERTAAAGERCCPLPVFALAASSFRLFPCGAAPT